MNFGEAIELLKKGDRVQRKGWNGNGMWLAIQHGSFIDKEKARGGVAKKIADEGHEKIEILPHIDMRNAKGQCAIGWVPSQEDMLSEDWDLVVD